MNQKIKQFLEKNGLIAENLPIEMKLNLTNPENFNKYLSYFYVQKGTVKKYITITDIIGSEAFEKEDSIYNLADKFFEEDLNEKNTLEKREDLLEIPFKDIIKRINLSFIDNPIILIEYDGKCFVRTSGNHRVIALYLNYLVEKQYAILEEDKIKLKEKFTFPVLVMETDTNKSYANFMLQTKKTGNYVDREFCLEKMKYTDRFELVEKDNREIILDESKVCNLIRKEFILAIKNKNIDYLNEVLIAIKEKKSFKRYFHSVFPEIENENIEKDLEKIINEIKFRKLEFFEVNSLDKIIEIINLNEELLEKQKRSFEKFCIIVSKTNEKMKEFFSIMQFESNNIVNIENIKQVFRNFITEIENTFSIAYEKQSYKLYKTAEKMLFTLGNLDFSLLSREYSKRSIYKIKEKISKLAVELKADAEVKNLEKIKAIELNKKFNFLGKMLGKQKFRNAIVKNIELQIKYAQINRNNIVNMEEAVRDLYNFTKNNEVTPEIAEFMLKLKCLDNKTDFIQLEKICIECFLPVKLTGVKSSTKEKIRLLEKENIAIEEKLKENSELMNTNNKKEKMEKEKIFDIILNCINKAMIEKKEDELKEKEELKAIFIRA